MIMIRLLPSHIFDKGINFWGDHKTLTVLVVLKNPLGTMV